MRIIDQLVYKISGDSTDFNNEIDKSDKKFGTFGSNVKKVMAGIGITIALREVINVTRQAVADFAIFETSIAKTSTLFGDVAVDVDNLSGKILDLSSRTGLAADSIGNSLYNALSAGIPVTEDMGEAMDFMERNARLATAGFTDMDTAVTATAKILNAYGLEVSETDRIHTILMQTQNKGITTVGELGGSLAKVTPTAAAFGVAFEDIGASLATMTSQGFRTEVATTYLSGLISELGKQGTIASDALLEVATANGMAETSMKDMLASGMNLGEVIQLMTEYANENNLSVIDMFGSIEAGKAALSISGENIDAYNRNLVAMSTNTDVVGDAFNKMQNTVSAQSIILQTQIKNLGIAFGQSLEGPVSSAMAVLNNFIGTLTGNRDATSKLRDATAGLVSASNEYNTIVNKLTGDVSALNRVELAQLQARKAQLQLDMFTSLKEQSSAYEELLSVKDKNAKADEIAQGNLEAYEKSLAQQAKTLGLVGAESVSTADLIEYLSENVKDGSREQRAFIRVMEGRAEIEGEIAERVLSTAAAEASRQAFIAETAALVADGTLTLEQYKNVDRLLYDQIMEQADGMKENMAVVAQQAAAGLESGVETIKEVGAESGDAFVEGVEESLEIASPSKRMEGIGKYIMMGLGIGIKEGEKPIADQFEEFLEGLDENSKDAANRIRTSISSSFSVFRDLYDVVSSGGDAWSVFAAAGMEAVASVIDSLGEMLAIKAAEATVLALFGDFSKIPAAVAATAGSIAAYTAAGYVRSQIPSYDVGSIRIPQTQQAVVHKDEMILTAPQAEQARREGITISPNGGYTSAPIHLVVNLNGRAIIDETVKGINSGQYGKIDTRITK